MSSYTGDGFDKFMEAVDTAREEYMSEYRVDLDRRMQSKNEVHPR